MLVKIADDFSRFFFMRGNLKQASELLFDKWKIIFWVEKIRKRRKTMRICLTNDAMLGRTHVLRCIWNHEVSYSNLHRIFHTHQNDANNFFPLFLAGKCTFFGNFHSTQHKFIEKYRKNQAKNWFTCIRHFLRRFSFPFYTVYSIRLFLYVYNVLW